MDNKNTIAAKKQDAENFIKNILKTVPEEKKSEILILMEGYALGVAARKAG